MATALDAGRKERRRSKSHHGQRPQPQETPPAVLAFRGDKRVNGTS